MNGELLVAALLLAVIALQAVIIWKMNERYMAKQSELLDRIMARDYAQLIQAEVAREQVKKPLTAEEIFEMQERRDSELPV